MTSSEQSSVRGQLRRADKVMSDTETHAFLQAAFCGRTASVDRDDDRVCFEVDEPGEVFPYGDLECDTSIAYRSVVLFGRIALVQDVERARTFFSLFMRKYAPADSWGRAQGSFPRIEATNVYAIAPESMTGKIGVLPAVEARWPAVNHSLSPQAPRPTAAPPIKRS